LDSNASTQSGRVPVTHHRKKLKQRYLIAVPVPFVRDLQGRVWLEDMWWADLRAHFEYLENVTVLAPLDPVRQAPKGWVEATAPAGTRLRFIAIFPIGGLRKVLRHLPRAICIAWEAVKGSDIVHSSVAGWPVPVGAFVNPMCVMQSKPLIVIIESAFWRLREGEGSSAVVRARSWLNELFAKWSLRRATLGVYTQSE
jgi:hypothetical protein